MQEIISVIQNANQILSEGNLYGEVLNMLSNFTVNLQLLHSLIEKKELILDHKKNDRI